MDVDALREQNQQKAQEEAERGPVRAEPDAAPIGDALRDFHERGALSFGIPADRAGTGDVVPDAAAWTGMDAFRADQGMNDGVDDRHPSWQVEQTAMQLFAQVRALVDAHGEADQGGVPDVPPTEELRMETVMLPRDAFLGATEMVPDRQAAGRVSAEMICPYPPGIPVTAPGELLTPVVVDHREQLAGAGVMVEGAADTSLEQLRVVASP